GRPISFFRAWPLARSARPPLAAAHRTFLPVGFCRLPRHARHSQTHPAGRFPHRAHGHRLRRALPQMWLLLLLGRGRSPALTGTRRTLLSIPPERRTPPTMAACLFRPTPAPSTSCSGSEPNRPAARAPARKTNTLLGYAANTIGSTSRVR